MIDARHLQLLNKFPLLPIKNEVEIILRHATDLSESSQ